MTLSRPAFALAALAALAAAVFWPGLGGGFLFDDYPNLVNDPDWRIRSLTLAECWRAMTHGLSSASGRPLAMLSFGIDHLLFGLDPHALKRTNILIHLINASLVLVLAQKLFRFLPADAAQPGRVAAFLLACAWLMHPLQVSSVLYIVQRMELGAHTFVLLALLAYLRARQAQIAGDRAWTWWLASGAALMLGLGFKETSLLVPGYALLIELTLLHFRGAENRPDRGLIGLYAVGCIATVALFLLVILPGYATSAAYAARDFSVGERLLTQMPVLVMYLDQMVLPIPAKMVFYYDHLTISRSLLDPATTLAAGLLLLALISVAIAVRRRWPLTALGIGWFFVAHALTSNVVPLELAFEHRNYFALLGLLLALVQPLRAAGARLNADARVVLAILPVLALAIFASLHVHTWAEPMRLAMSLASQNPDSPRASYALGALMLEQSGNDSSTPMWSLARKEFQHSASLPNSPALAEQAIIMMDGRSGKAVSAEAWSRFRSKLTAKTQLGAQEIESLYAISHCRIAGQCTFDDRELLHTFVTVLGHNPRSARLHTLYANFAWNVLKDTTLAVQMAREAVELAPRDIDYQVNLAQFLSAQELLENIPGNQQELQGLLGNIRRANRGGRLDGAINEIEARLSGDPARRQRHQMSTETRL